MARLSLGGRTVSDNVLWAPQPLGIGVGFSIFSYAGAIRVGVAADEACVPEPAALVEAFEAELASLGVAGGEHLVT